MMISIIAAMAKNRVIGAHGKLPWHLPVDIKHFRAKTLGKPVVMGRKTYESIGKPLALRRNIVLTRKLDYHAVGCELFHSFESIMAKIKDSEEILVIGGASLYQQVLLKAQRLYLTLIDLKITGDTFFPPWNAEDWKIIDEKFYRADKNNKYHCHFIDLQRRVEKASLECERPIHHNVHHVKWH